MDMHVFMHSHRDTARVIMVDGRSLDVNASLWSAANVQ